MVWQQWLYLITAILGGLVRIAKAGDTRLNPRWESGGELCWMLIYMGLYTWLILSI